MYQTLQYECADGIATVRFNRPGKLNAINPEMIDDLRKLAADIRADPGARVVIFTGNGRAFCAGADIAALTKVGGPPDFMSFIENVQTAFNGIDDLDRPTIAAINGIAYGGGCEISLCCDFRIIAEDTSIGVPEIKIGLLPGAGGTQRLPRMLPTAIAKQMIYTGEPLTRSAGAPSRARQRNRAGGPGAGGRESSGRASCSSCRRWDSDAGSCWSISRRTVASRPVSKRSARRWRSCTRPRTARKGWPRSSSAARRSSAGANMPGIQAVLTFRRAGRAEISRGLTQRRIGRIDSKQAFALANGMPCSDPYPGSFLKWRR